MRTKSVVIGILCIMSLAAKKAATGDIDAAIKKLPFYGYDVHKPKLSGRLSAVGSDTMVNLMTMWSEDFRRFHPKVVIEVEGKGSSTAVPALIKGTAQLGPMSREMKASEVEEFRKKYGFTPTQVKVAVDALGIFVHKDNPLQRIRLEQVDAIFSSTRRLGAAKPMVTWGELGIAKNHPLAKKPIVAFGRNSASGTYGFFKDIALGKGDFKSSVREEPGSAGVVNGVSSLPHAIGYSGIGYRTADIKLLNVAEAGIDTFSEPSFASVKSGDYPLARYLYIYVVKDPKIGLSPLVREFIRYIQSQNGQLVVQKEQFLPIDVNDVLATAPLAKKPLQKKEKALR